jgi:hypothetical protein
MFDRIGGYLGLAFYGAQALALGGGLIVRIAGGDMNAWLRWWAAPMVGLGVALVLGMPAVGAAMAMWKVFWEG